MHKYWRANFADMPLVSWYLTSTKHFRLTILIRPKWTTQPNWGINPVTHSLVQDQILVHFILRHRFFTFVLNDRLNNFLKPGNQAENTNFGLGRVDPHAYLFIAWCHSIYHESRDLTGGAPSRSVTVYTKHVQKKFNGGVAVNVCDRIHEACAAEV